MALLTKTNCDLTADTIAKAVEDGTSPSWFQRNVDWYREDQISCQDLLNATGYLLQEEVIEKFSFNSIFQEILQDANLVSLGRSSVDISEALDRQIAIRQKQRLEDREYLEDKLRQQQEKNDLISGQLVDLGKASVDISGALEDQSRASFFGDLFTGALGGSSLIVLGIILVMMIGRK